MTDQNPEIQPENQIAASNMTSPSKRETNINPKQRFSITYVPRLSEHAIDQGGNLEEAQFRVVLLACEVERLSAYNYTLARENEILRSHQEASVREKELQSKLAIVLAENEKLNQIIEEMSAYTHPQYNPQEIDSKIAQLTKENQDWKEKYDTLAKGNTEAAEWQEKLDEVKRERDEALDRARLLEELVQQLRAAGPVEQSPIGSQQQVKSQGRLPDSEPGSKPKEASQGGRDFSQEIKKSDVEADKQAGVSSQANDKKMQDMVNHVMVLRKELQERDKLMLEIRQRLDAVMQQNALLNKRLQEQSAAGGSPKYGSQQSLKKSGTSQQAGGLKQSDFVVEEYVPDNEGGGQGVRESYKLDPSKLQEEEKDWNEREAKIQQDESKREYSPDLEDKIKQLAEELENKDAEVGNLKGELENKEKELGELRDIIESLKGGESSNADLLKKITNLLGENEKLQTTLVVKSRELEDLKGKCDELLVVNAGLNDALLAQEAQPKDVGRESVHRRADAYLLEHWINRGEQLIKENEQLKAQLDVKDRQIQDAGVALEKAENDKKVIVDDYNALKKLLEQGTQKEYGQALGSKERELDDKNRLIENLQKKIEQQNVDSEKIDQRLMVTMAKLDEKENQLEKLQASKLLIENQERRIQDLVKEREALEQNLVKRQEEVRDLKMGGGGLSDRSGQKISTPVKRTIDLVKDQLGLESGEEDEDDVKKINSKIKRALRAVLGELGRLRDELTLGEFNGSNLEEVNQKLRRELAEKVKLIGELSGNLVKRESELSVVKILIKRVETLAKEGHDLKKALGSKNNTLREKINNLEGELDRIKKERDDVANEVQQMKAVVEEKGLQEQLERLKEVFGDKEKEIEKLNDEIQNLQNQSNIDKERNESVQKESNTLKGRVGLLEGTVESLRKGDSGAAVKDLQEAINNLTKENDRLNEELELREKEIKALNEKN